MELPNDPTVYIILIVVLALVVGFAVWRRYNVVLKRGDTELRLEQPSENAGAGPGAATAGVSVGQGMTISNSKVGNITGVKAMGRVSPIPSVDVLSGAKAENAEIGDITGVNQGGKTR
ncbi:MAG TPA: hypothetical protein VMW18_05170 [Candidatus Binatia bacterium]|nr:hypothetical protein [Candidatus Binatia bacterium]